MKNLKTKVLIGIILVAALTAAWYMSGSAPSPKIGDIRATETQSTANSPAKASAMQDDEEQQSKKEGQQPSSPSDYSDDASVASIDPASDSNKISVSSLPSSNGEFVPAQSEPLPQPDIEDDTSKQSFPPPVEPEDMTITDKEERCTLSITCSTAAASDKLKPEKVGIVPSNGIIFPETEVVFYSGESVFNLLLRETKKNKIHFEFVKTPVYNSAYIEGIANLYEFECGELSGWLYKVNGEFPNYGCSRYALKPGDKIELVYTCDLGRDVGGYALESGWQKDE